MAGTERLEQTLRESNLKNWQRSQKEEFACADKQLWSCATRRRRGVWAARQPRGKERKGKVWSECTASPVGVFVRPSVGRWEWPRSSRGAELQTVVTSVTPRLSYCAVTLNWHFTAFQSKWTEMLRSQWINEAFRGLDMRLLNRTCDLCSLIWLLYLTLITQSVSFDCGQRLILTLHTATLMIFALVQTGGAGVKLCTSLWHINNWTEFLGRTTFQRCEFCFVSSFLTVDLFHYFNCIDPFC